MSFLTRGARLCAVWLLLALAAWPLAPARAQSIRVSDVEIRGNQRINRESILTVVTTKKGDELSAERVERDRLAIEGLGWFRLVVSSLDRQGDEARVIFTVTEYPVVNELQISGSSIYKDEQLRGPLKTKTGQVFNRVNWDADLTAIQKLYSDKGYQVRLQDNLDQPDFQEKGIIRLTIFELKVGDVRLVWPTREVKVKGAKKEKSDSKRSDKTRSKEKSGAKKPDQGASTAPAKPADTGVEPPVAPDTALPEKPAAPAAPGRTVETHKTRNYVVLRELSLRPGALYNTQQLQKDYRALSNLGYFETIDPTVEVAENQTVTITWKLTEKRTGQVSVGAGYSPRQQLIGRAELADTNFQGKGQSLSVSGEIGTFGGDGLPSVEVQFTEPWLTAKKTSLTVNLHDKLIYRFSEDLISNTNKNTQYYERRLGGSLAFGRPFQWPITLGLRFDAVKTRDFNKKFNFPQQNGNVGALQLARTFNTRDYANNPTTGNYVRLTTEAGIASLDKSNTTDQNFGTQFFNKYIADLRKYIRLKHLKATQEPQREQESQKVPVLALRFLAGATVGKVPFFEQFFLGGAETLRGYREDRFWGNQEFLASVEYRRPIINRIVGVLFVDVGDAWGSESSFRFSTKSLRTDFAQHTGLNPAAAIGVGLRVATPIGPIRLDFGYGREGGRTHFSIGHTF